MATKTKAAKGKAKPKKGKLVKDKSFLPGMEPRRDPVLHKQAERLKEAREKVGNARELEKDILGKLIELMHERSVKEYRYGEINIQLDAKENVKFRNHKKAAESNGAVSEDQGSDFPDALDDSAGETSAKKVDEEEEEPAATK